MASLAIHELRLENEMQDFPNSTYNKTDHTKTKLVSDIKKKTHNSLHLVDAFKNFGNFINTIFIN